MTEALRPVTPADCSRLAEIEAEAGESSWSEQAIRETLCHADGMAACGNDGTVAGFVLYRVLAPECEILDIAVDPASQRRGVGRRLLDAALRDARARGARRCFLEVRVSNSAAQALYRALGFGEHGRRRNYYRRADGREDAILLGCDLDRGEHA